MISATAFRHCCFLFLICTLTFHPGVKGRDELEEEYFVSYMDFDFPVDGVVAAGCEWMKTPQNVAAPKSSWAKAIQSVAIQQCIFKDIYKKHLNDLQRDLKFNISATTFSDLLQVQPPPSDLPSRQTTVEIKNIVLDQVSLEEWNWEFNMRASLEMTWEDTRLSWDSATYSNVMNISVPTIDSKGTVPVWTPVLAQTTVSVWDYAQGSFKLGNPTVTSAGYVSTKLNFRAFQHCSADLTNYPTDVQNCCINLRQTPDSPANVAFSVFNRTILLPLHSRSQKYTAKWKVNKAVVASADGDPVLTICCEIERYFVGASARLKLPVAIAGFILVLSPLFGSLQLQISVRFFVLLLLFLALQMTNNIPYESWYTTNNSTPRFLLFFEVTTIATITSLSFSVVIWAFSRVRHRFAPPHRLCVLAEAFNRLFCIDDVIESTKVEFRNGNAELDSDSSVLTTSATQRGGANASYWLSILLSINNAIMLIIYVIYALTCFGVLV